MKKDVELGSGRTVGAVLRFAELNDEAAPIVAEGSSLTQVIESLVQAELFVDAVVLLAQALPEREAVGWAWVCAREAAGEEPPEAVAEILDATRAWIKEPSDDVRRAAMDLVEAAGMDTPAGLAAVAAFFCGDSIGPAEYDPVPPPEGVVGKLVAGCISLAAAQGDPVTIGERMAGFTSRGRELAKRVELWPADTASSSGD